LDRSLQGSQLSSLEQDLSADKKDPANEKAREKSKPIGQSARRETNRRAADRRGFQRHDDPSWFACHKKRD
jgi:hypothetical protein